MVNISLGYDRFLLYRLFTNFMICKGITGIVVFVWGHSHAVS